MFLNILQFIITPLPSTESSTHILQKLNLHFPVGFPLKCHASNWNDDKYELQSCFLFGYTLFLFSCLYLWCLSRAHKTQ